ncbi:MAG TPA: metalloregulator ArsR/SmtB family transcription factor [Gemmatimonadales bacterium]|nr:metalloregulator ArsR/SmtB family transcription factor [Gemmatimonadales bacterium]
MTAAAPPARRRPAVDVPRLAELAHALSDETRVAVLELLRFGERCVCDLQADLDVAQSRLSFHLRVLRDAGLVVDRREGRWAYYALTPAAIEELHDLVVKLRPRLRSLPVRREACCG